MALINLQNFNTMAEVQVNFSPGAAGPIEVMVPKGTLISDLSKIHLAIDKQIGKKINPRGCAPCLSGAHFIIKEMLDGNVNVKY